MVLQAKPDVPNHCYVQTSLHTQEKHQVKTPTPQSTSTRFSPRSIERGKALSLAKKCYAKSSHRIKATNSICSCKRIKPQAVHHWQGKENQA
jgi:hypothetical protein